MIVPRWFGTIFALACCALLGCRQAPLRSTTDDAIAQVPDLNACAPRELENLQSLLWMQTSAEFYATVRQTYAAAQATLEHALHDKTWTAAVEQTGDFTNKPPAVILDIDETILDN